MGHVVVLTEIEAPPEVCFDYALDVAAHVESASFSGEKLVAPGKVEGQLKLGDIVCFEGYHFGIRQRFCAQITEYDRPRRFSDEMVHGLFKWLRHVHEFEDHGGRTLMRDTLDWKAPVPFADALFLERHMRSFVSRKQRALRQIIERTARR
jgi:ligand-binding SRPBCC domain-containing protein